MFVTSLALLGMAATVVCCNFRAVKTQVYSSEEVRGHLVTEGNDKLRESAAIQQELLCKFQVAIGDRSEKCPAIERNAKVTANQWQHLRRAERRQVQGLLARYLQMINRVLEIDSMNSITIDHREKILSARDSAQALQKSIETFEALQGESVDPHSTEPAPHNRQANND